MRELANIQSFAPKTTLLLLIHTRFSIQFLYQTADSFRLSITQCVEYGWNGIFMSYPTDLVIDGEITNIRSSKCVS